MKCIRLIHPDATETATSLPREDLPITPTISRTLLRKTAKKMDETSAVGPDGMNVNHLRLLLRVGLYDRTAHAGETTVLAYLQIAADGRIFPASSRTICLSAPH